MDSSSNWLEGSYARVARYFFNQINGVFKPDDDGLDFPTLEDARIGAVQYAGEMLRDHPTLV